MEMYSIIDALERDSARCTPLEARYSMGEVAKSQRRSRNQLSITWETRRARVFSKSLQCIMHARTNGYVDRDDADDQTQGLRVSIRCTRPAYTICADLLHPYWQSPSRLPAQSTQTPCFLCHPSSSAQFAAIHSPQSRPSAHRPDTPSRPPAAEHN